MPAEITWWDYNQRLEFGRVMLLNMDRVREETRLPSETDIRLTCTLFCPDSHLRHHVFKSAEPIEETSSKQEIQFAMEGEWLAGEIILITELVLAQPHDLNIPFVAKKAGQVLARDSHKMSLEGSRNRFPTEAVDFSTSGPWSEAKQACWHLEWSPLDLDSPFMRSVRLFLNSKNERFIEKATDPKSTIASVVYQDVARRIVTGVLTNDDFIENYDNYSAESVGGVASRQLKVFYPGRSIREIKALYDSDKDRFETILQGRLPIEFPKKTTAKTEGKEQSAPTIRKPVKAEQSSKGGAPTLTLIEPETVVEPGKQKAPVARIKEKRRIRKKRAGAGQKSGDPATAAKGDIFELAVGGGEPVKKLRLGDLTKVVDRKTIALTRKEFRAKYGLGIYAAKKWYTYVYAFVLKQMKGRDS